VYLPKVRPQTVVRETVDLLFGGETMPLMKPLVKERKFSADEIDRLRQLLDQREGAHDAR
jgi:predicted transcriptional regulator